MILVGGKLNGIGKDLLLVQVPVLRLLLAQVAQAQALLVVLALVALVLILVVALVPSNRKKAL